MVCVLLVVSCEQELWLTLAGARCCVSWDRELSCNCEQELQLPVANCLCEGSHARPFFSFYVDHSSSRWEDNSSMKHACQLLTGVIRMIDISPPVRPASDHLVTRTKEFPRRCPRARGRPRSKQACNCSTWLTLFI